MIKRLLVMVFLLGSALVAHGQADSLGIEKRGEQVLVIHKVKSGQTLFALAKRYGANVKQIQDANPALQQGLKVGQTIKIPYGKTLPVVPTVAPKAGKTHTVAAGETLYAISRKYGVSVDEIKKLNKLTSNALARGQELVIEVATATPQPEVIVPAETPTVSQPEEDTTTVVSDPESVVTEEETPSDTTAQLIIPVAVPPLLVADTTNEGQASPEIVKYNGTQFKQIEEEGVAQLIEEEEPTNKFLALHKTAKVGTVIKIRNLKNDLAVYVRVVGNIPETADNSNILIKINKRAHDQLKAIDSQLRVELSYFQ